MRGGLPWSENPGNRHFSCGGFERGKSRAVHEALRGSQGREELDEAGEGGRSRVKQGVRD